MEYNQQAALRSLRGAQNRTKGKAFEEYIEKACQNYSDRKIARIEKTPEPFHITKSKGGGKFEGHFEKAAQPDYKGTLQGGKAICFDAKATDTDRILLSVLSEEQADALAEHALLGGIAGVLVTFSFKTFAFIPFGTFIRARSLNGHKYWNEKDCEPYKVYIRDGYLDFLDNRTVDPLNIHSVYRDIIGKK